MTINHVFDTNTEITKIIPTLYDMRNKICKEYLDKMRNEFYDIISEPIRVNSKLKEAPKYGKSIFAYDIKSRGAKDYTQLVKSVINDENKFNSAESTDSVELKSAKKTAGASAS